MKLSILVCHLEQRAAFLKRLFNCLFPQLNNSVELLFDSTPNISIGAKRNLLLAKSTGEYVCFIDDDDLVAANYVALILSALKDSPDVVGITGIYTTDGANPVQFLQSLNRDSKFGPYYKPPNHLNPVKRELALATGFKDISNGEDTEFSIRLQKLLKTERLIPEPIYFYHFLTRKRD